jgi:hypothetical protein
MEMLAQLDFERGFYILQHCMGHLQQLDEWDAAIKLFKKRHGTLAGGVAATLQEEVRRNVIKSLRSTIIEPEHRFFLALLMNAPTRADLLSLMASRFPKAAPVATILRWVEELTEVSDEGVTILDASFPETLEVESEAQPHLFLSAFRHFMQRDKKLPPVMRNLPAADVKKLRAVFAESTLGLLTVRKPGSHRRLSQAPFEGCAKRERWLLNAKPFNMYIWARKDSNLRRHKPSDLQSP